MQIQVFGLAKSKATRKAQRFFSDRRVPVSFVDCRIRPPSAGELRKWVQRFGAEALLDETSKSYREQALQYVSAGEEDWIRRMQADPTILALPLVRCGSDLAYGDDPDAWGRCARAVTG